MRSPQSISPIWKSPLVYLWQLNSQLRDKWGEWTFIFRRENLTAGYWAKVRELNMGKWTFIREKWTGEFISKVGKWMSPSTRGSTYWVPWFVYYSYIRVYTCLIIYNFPWEFSAVYTASKLNSFRPRFSIADKSLNPYYRVNELFDRKQ